MQTKLVRDGYDKIAAKYLAHRDKLKSAKYIQQLLKYLPKQSLVLDLGCGAGIPVDDILLKAGHSVIGLDISSEQIKLARKYCKGGEYSVRDISDLKAGEYQVQSVISFYTLFHIPKDRQLKMLKTIASFLSPKGMLLITMGDRAFEGEHTLYGAPMWSSQYGTKENRTLVEAAGFRILIDEVDTSGAERHQIIMGEKL
ncbi:MAG: class I SAM-dependent methyltransferase [Microgenomates group bacterium]